MQRHGRAASLLDSLYHLFGRLDIDVGNDHAGAALGQQQGRGRANAAGASRHDRYLILLVDAYCHLT